MFSYVNPNPQVKKVGVTPNPDQIFTSAVALAAPAGGGGVPPLFLPKMSSFRQKAWAKKPKIWNLGNKKKKCQKKQTRFFSYKSRLGGGRVEFLYRP